LECGCRGITLGKKEFRENKNRSRGVDVEVEELDSRPGKAGEQDSCRRISGVRMVIIGYWFHHIMP
jgi:hypothetical protein